MTSPLETYAEQIKALSARIAAGADAVIAEARKPPVPVGMPCSLANEKALFDAIRPMLPNGQITADQFQTIKAALALALLPPQGSRSLPTIGLTAADYDWAAKRLGWSTAQIKAVDLTESSGGGWFTDMRANILALDGDGGFLDGKALPKILYEAHVFARNCDPAGMFNAQAPNLSSAKWNRSLYVGGQGEYERLWKAMQLDRNAAFCAVSVGRYQILGENHAMVGFGTAESFFQAMCVSERAHLEAFVNFIVHANLVDAGRQISADPAACVAFAKGYNGKAAAQNGYADKLAGHYHDALTQ